MEFSKTRVERRREPGVNTGNFSQSTWEASVRVNVSHAAKVPANFSERSELGGLGPFSILASRFADWISGPLVRSEPLL